MAATTIRRPFGPFTATEHIFLTALGAEYHGSKAATDMRTVAKWLPTAASAAAPDIAFVFREVDFNGIFLSNMWFVHAHMLNHCACIRQSSIG